MTQTQETTGRDLSADEAFESLLDYGLFSEKLPPCFISEGLAGYVSKEMQSLNNIKDHDKLREFLRKRVHGFIRFEALRNTNIPRQIGIPHPESYMIQCLVLKQHWEEIKQHCARPRKAVSRVFVRKIRDMKSVFQMNYKGSGRFQDEEVDIYNMAGAQNIVSADISSCFPSIYTHSIPWAMHGLNKAKRERSPLLMGNLLDRVTSGIRDGQTNGILIGPHTSNIISEIVLTKTDSELLKLGYECFNRKIDDYTFYAKDYAEAENFVRDLGLSLRSYDLNLNHRKTEISSMPQTMENHWVRALRSFQWPGKNDSVSFGVVRAFMDLALDLAQQFDNNAVLSYAFKVVPSRLTNRARRLFVQLALNLTLLYPYLIPFLNEQILEKHEYPNMETNIREFTKQLLDIGIRKVYPDAIVFALYYSIQYNFELEMIANEYQKILKIDDCLSNVLLFEYSRRNNLNKILRAVRYRADKLKRSERSVQDRHWLLLYQLWLPKTLASRGQHYLAWLKKRRLKFVSFS